MDNEEKWVIRTENGLLKWSLREPQHLIGEPPYLFWCPTKGWVKTPFEAKQYSTELGAKRAVAWFHGRRWQRDNVDVVRVTP